MTSPPNQARGVARLELEEKLEHSSLGIREAVRNNIGPRIGSALALIAQARQSLAEARELPEIRKVMVIAEIATDVAQQQRRLAENKDAVREAGLAAIDAEELRLVAEAAAGQLLKAMSNSGERDRGLGGDRKSQLPTDTVKTLADIGITKKESSTWQKVAEVPVEVRDQYIEEVRESGGDVSRAKLLSLIKIPKQQDSPTRTVEKKVDGNLHGCPDCGGMFIEHKECEWTPFEQSFELWVKRRKDRVRVLVSKYFQLSTVQQASTHSIFERRPIPKSESARKARRLRG